MLFPIQDNQNNCVSLIFDAMLRFQVLFRSLKLEQILH